MKLNQSLAVVLVVFLLGACTAGVNGVTVSSGQQYFSPYAASEEGTAVVYIYWNQADINRYFPIGTRKPEWNTYVNRKKNAELGEGSYSVVEVKQGRVTIEARRQFGASANLSDRTGHVSLSAKAGETYFIAAQLGQSNLGLELRLDREINQREAYTKLYGLKYQENLQESMLY